MSTLDVAQLIASRGTVSSPAGKRLAEQADRIALDAYRLAERHAQAARSVQANQALSQQGRLQALARLRERARQELERLAQELETLARDFERQPAVAELPRWSAIPAERLQLAREIVGLAATRGTTEPIERALHLAADAGRDVFAELAAAVLFWSEVSSFEQTVLASLVRQLLAERLLTAEERAQLGERAQLAKVLAVAQHALADARGFIERSEPLRPVVLLPSTGKPLMPDEVEDIARAVKAAAAQQALEVAQLELAAR